jgi:hypothetical protein
MQTVMIGKRGTVVIPAKARKDAVAMGVDPDSFDHIR